MTPLPDSIFQVLVAACLLLRQAYAGRVRLEGERKRLESAA